MQSIIGSHIRQFRRQLGLTQTELGGERYSKSYVSAIERGNLVPTYEAMRFFAQQLNQSIEEFIHLLQEHEHLLAPVSPRMTAVGESQLDEYHEMRALTELLLTGVNLSQGPPDSNVIALQPVETAIVQPLPRPARQAFLKGLLAQQRGDLETTLS